MQFFASLPRSRYHAAQACLFLVFAIILGGGNIDNPATELALGLLAALCAIAWIWMPGSLRLPSDWTLWAIAGLILLVPALQLVPLPPSVWTALPGRERELAALNLLGEADSWRPLSMSPHGTLISLLGLFPPVLMLLMAGALSRRARDWLLATLVIMALVTALVGVAQLGDKAGLFHLYDYSHRMVVAGFQNNRNHTADLLLVALLGLAALGSSFLTSRNRRDRNEWIKNLGFFGVAMVLILAVVFTRSRAGIALALPVMLAFGAMFSWSQEREWNRSLIAFIGGGIVMAVTGLFLLPGNTALQNVAARFELDRDGREAIWRNSLEAAQHYFPFGSGLGTFRSTYNAFEPLQDVHVKQAGYAHNDFLQLMLEAGLIGYLALAICLFLLLWMTFRSWKEDQKRRPQVMFGLFSLLVIAAHSQVDYPLRTVSMACIAAVAVAMLTRPAQPQDRSVFQRSSGSSRKSGSSLAVKSMLTVLALAYGFAALGSGMDRLSARSADAERYAFEPFRRLADTKAALAALSRMDRESGPHYAERAVLADPISQQALSSLALSRVSAGDLAGGRSAFEVAALGGWRDPATQLYWHGVAESEGDALRAAVWADAALRTIPGVLDMNKLLGPLEATAAGREAIAARLIQEPDWAAWYFAAKPYDPETTERKALVAKHVAALGHALGCELPLPLVNRLMAEGARASAASLWADHCDRSGLGPGIVDSDFAQLAAAQHPMPFGWTLHTGADLNIGFADRGADRPVLVLSNTSLVTKAVLSQKSLLEPGDYKVRITAGADSELPAGRIKVSYGCANRQPVLGPYDGDVAKDGQLLKVEECPAPTFRIWLSPAATPVSLAAVHLEKL